MHAADARPEVSWRFLGILPRVLGCGSRAATSIMFCGVWPRIGRYLSCADTPVLKRNAYRVPS
eukprot:5175625-Pyramimonas_sp.AAC.1